MPRFDIKSKNFKFHDILFLTTGYENKNILAELLTTQTAHNFVFSFPGASRQREKIYRFRQT